MTLTCRTVLLLLLTASVTGKAQEIKYIDLSLVRQRTAFRYPPAPPPACEAGKSCIGGGYGGMNIADGGHDRPNPHALGVHLLRVSPTDIDPVRPSFEVIDAPLVSLEGQDLSGTWQDSGASPKRSEYEMLGTLNGVPTVDGVKYPCSSLGVNSAISASIAAGGGTVDARPCPSLSSYTSEIDVGNDSSVAVTYCCPASGAGPAILRMAPLTA